MNQRGMALITVLLMLTLMATLVVVSQRQWGMVLQRNMGLKHQQQLKWTVYGAERWLLNHPPASAEGKIARLRLEDDTVSYRWQDRQACFNVNALGSTKGESSGRTDAQRIFARMLAQQGLEEAEIDKILSAVNARLSSSRQQQVEPMLDDKTQLRAIPGVSLLDWSLLAPHLCALPVTRLRINVNALTPVNMSLLSAMLDGRVDESTLHGVLARRPESGWKSVDEFIQALPEEGKALASTLQGVVVTQSEFWELQVWLKEKGSHRFFALRSQLQWNNTRLQVLYRQYGISESS